VVDVTPHLVLVGLPGAGKSTVGAAVAQRLGRPFLDFDVVIAEREGRSVADIFADRGEPYFRGLERALTQELATQQGMVLAPGSGWVVEPANVACLRPPARLVWLRVDPEVAVARLAASPVVRPLVQVADPLDRVRRLLDARRSAFEQADVVVDTGVAPLEAVVAHVVALATGSGPV
jgi:shikimate kinase